MRPAFYYWRGPERIWCDEPSWSANGQILSWHILGDDRVGSDPCAVPDLYATENAGSGTDGHVIANYWISVGPAAVHVQFTERDVLQEGRSIPDDRGTSDNDPMGMTDEQGLANLGAGYEIRTGQGRIYASHHSRKPDRAGVESRMLEPHQRCSQ
jgi:hypothetical protein